MRNREPDRGTPTATPLNVSYRIGRISHYLCGHWLDFGCADGGYVEGMLAHGLRAVTGVDVEEDRIGRARLRNLPNAEFSSFDGATLPFEDETFDGAFLNEVLEHVACFSVQGAAIFRPATRSSPSGTSRRPPSLAL